MKIRVFWESCSKEYVLDWGRWELALTGPAAASSWVQVVPGEWVNLGRVERVVVCDG